MAGDVSDDAAPAPVPLALLLPPGLNPKQVRFALEFRRHRNRSQAARDAGYSARTAGVQGYELLKKPAIRDFIARLDAEHVESLYASAARVLGELVAVGFADMRNYLSFDPVTGAPDVNFENMPIEATRAIQEMRQDRFVRGRGPNQVVVTRTRIKLFPKGPALAELAKILATRTGTPHPSAPGQPASGPIDRAALLRELEARFVAVHERERQAFALLGASTAPPE